MELCFSTQTTMDQAFMNGMLPKRSKRGGHWLVYLSAISCILPGIDSDNLQLFNIDEIIYGMGSLNFSNYSTVSNCFILYKHFLATEQNSLK